MKESVRSAIHKAVEDDNFKKKLIENPDEVLKSFDLSDDEKAKFKNITPETIAMYKNNLDKRASKAGSGSDEELDWWVESVTD